MSSSSTTSSAPNTAAKGPRPSALGPASPRLAAQPGHLQGTSPPVASSTLRDISGSGTDSTQGLRPDSPVPPRALLGDPRGPPAHLGCLQQVWDTMGPTLRARIGSISREDVEAGLAHAPAAAEVGDPARSAADACALYVAEEEHVLVMQSLQARWSPSTPLTPISGTASATLTSSGAPPPRKWRRPNATTRRSPPA